MGALWAAAFSLAIIGLSAQPASDTTKLIQEADRLAWLRAWGAAEPLYAEAEKLFAARGDQRNALYAQISVLRGQLPSIARSRGVGAPGRVPGTSAGPVGRPPAIALSGDQGRD